MNFGVFSLSLADPRFDRNDLYSAEYIIFTSAEAEYIDFDEHKIKKTSLNEDEIFRFMSLLRDINNRLES